jgi:hypothetical protein
MARQEDTCWRCGALWATEDEPQTTLRLIPGDADTRSQDAPSEVTLPLFATAGER